MGTKYTHILVDGGHFCRSNFYSHKELSVVKLGIKRGGKIKTGVAFGCFTSLSVLQRRWLEKNGTLIIAMDRGSARKKKIYPQYKESRKKKKDEEEYKDFEKQKMLFEAMLKYTKFTSVYAKGEEADDVIATLIQEILEVNPKARILIVSADKDFHQLIITSHISQMIKNQAKKHEIYQASDIMKVYGVIPEEFLAFQLIMGDKGDDVPGVIGIGKVKARKILEASTAKEVRLLLEKQVLPIALIEWLRKDKRNPSRDWQKFFQMTIQLLRLKNDIKSIKWQRGKNNSKRLTDLFIEYEFFSLVKSNRIADLVREK